MTNTATDEAAAALGDKAAPGHVESGEEQVKGYPFTQGEANRCLGELVLMDLRAREHGHTLADVIAKAAQDAFGIDVRDRTAPEPEA